MKLKYFNYQTEYGSKEVQFYYENHWVLTFYAERFIKTEKDLEEQVTKFMLNRNHFKWFDIQHRSNVAE